MSTPTQMYDHELNAVRGWPSPYAVDKFAQVGDLTEAIIAGMVLSLDANARFRMGLYADAMAIFALQSVADYDVTGDDGNFVGNGNAVSGIPTMSGLAACGAYELESTEFNPATSFAPNNLLTSPVPGAANAGRLELGVKWVNTICGVVSDGVISNERGVNVLRFWPVWLPR